MSLRRNQHGGFLQKRVKLIFIALISIIIANLVALMTLEGETLLNSIYFLVITVSTVGYGDITPENNITKVLLILLIVSTLTILATFSEYLFETVASNREGRILLERTEIKLESHIIIANIVQDSLILAQLFQERFMEVIMIDPDREQVHHAQRMGVKAFAGDILDPTLFPNLNLSAAECVYLFLPTNNQVLKAAAMLRGEGSHLEIYALTLEHPISQQFANRVGITRVYSYERIIGSFISVITRQIGNVIFANQPERDSKLFFAIIAPKHFVEIDSIFSEYYVMGIINYEQANFYRSGSPEFEELYMKYKNNEDITTYAFSIVYPREIEPTIDTKHFVQFESDEIPLEARFHHIYIFGYNKRARDVVRNLRVSLDRFRIVTFENREAEAAREDGLDVFCLNSPGEIEEYVEQHIHADDIVFNFITDFEESLHVTVAIRDTEKTTVLHQIANDRYEAEMYRNLGVHGIINPSLLIVRAMMQIHLRNGNYAHSTIYQQSHSFEQIISEGHPFHGKRLKDVQNMGYAIILFLPHGRKFTDAVQSPLNQDHRLESGDSILLEITR